jgi:hypothetical protein
MDLYESSTDQVDSAGNATNLCSGGALFESSTNEVDSTGNATDLCSGGALFESRPVHRLS